MSKRFPSTRPIGKRRLRQFGRELVRQVRELRSGTPGICCLCGCTSHDACIDEQIGEPCWWVDYDLCSHCVVDLVREAMLELAR